MPVKQRIEPTLQRADFFVSPIQFIPMSKTYIPKYEPKKAGPPPTLNAALEFVLEKYGDELVKIFKNK